MRLMAALMLTLLIHACAYHSPEESSIGVKSEEVSNTNEAVKEQDASMTESMARILGTMVR